MAILVDTLNDEPIERITPRGIQTSKREHEFDILIYATGFDGVTGAFDRIDIRGKNGVRLKDAWADSPHTYLGMLAEGFPNMMMVLGPHTARGNIPQAVEHSVEFQTGILRFMREHGYTRVETQPEHVAEWTETVIKAAEPLLSSKVNSWQTGVNRNVEGRSVRRVLGYNGHGVHFRRKTDESPADTGVRVPVSAHAAGRRLVPYTSESAHCPRTAPILVTSVAQIEGAPL